MTFQRGHEPLGRALKGHITTEETKEKIRQKAIGRPSKLKGIKFTEEHKMKLSLNHADVSGKNNPMFGIKRPELAERQRGINNPNWKSGIGIYQRVAYEKYGKLCNRCKSDRFILVHHKDRNRQNNNVKNLEVLCKRCHNKEHGL